jgi:RNA polymerase sigma-54 factor
MKPGLSQNISIKQELKINPRLYQAMDLLYMPLLDLQQHLKQELLNNPFLDMVEPEEEEEEGEESTDTETEQPEAQQETDSTPAAVAKSMRSASTTSRSPSIRGTSAIT